MAPEKRTAKPAKKPAAKSVKKRATKKTGARAVAPKAAKAVAGGARTDPQVSAYMAALDHPMKQELESVRRLILAASPKIREGFKWNSASFRTSEYFATVNVHGKESLRLILHLGAKVKDNTKALKIADPKGLLQWLGKDRALVTLGDAKDIQGKKPALQAIIREWAAHL